MQLLNQDCYEYLKTLKNNSIDMILTDPPFGITKESWDVTPSKEIFDQILRVGKKAIIFGGNFFDLPKKDGWIVWNKMPFLKTTNECELLYTNFLKKNKKIDFRYAGNCVGNSKPDYKREKVYFTSQKPVEFLEVLLKEYTNENDLVLDCFMGTGTTGLACKNLNRKFIGIDKNEKHFLIAKEKLK